MNKKPKKQWNIQNIPDDLDTKVRMYLINNKLKLYEFVIKAVENEMQREFNMKVPKKEGK